VGTSSLDRTTIDAPCKSVVGGVAEGRAARVAVTAVRALNVSVATFDDLTDERGNFDWAAPDDEVHAFVNDLVRPVGTYLYGRRMYETMVYSATAPTSADQPAVMRDFAQLWQAADKVVYSTTLDSASSPRTQIERTFDPETVRAMKASAHRDIAVGDPSSPPRRCGPDWSMSVICSSRRS